MSLDPALRARIDGVLADNRIVLFMKGSPAAPQCGFSAKASGILNGLGVEYGHVDVLADPAIREGIKTYGNWPTVPQLYIDRELVGGSDIVEHMLNTGELHAALGLPEPDRTPPAITISDEAAEAIRSAMADADPGMALHLSIGPRFDANLRLAEPSGHEVVAEANGIRVYFDVASAPRAQGLQIGWTEGPRGAGIAIHNPNAPGPVKPLTVAALKARLDAGDITVVDVRPVEDREFAPFPGAEVLDQASHDRLAAFDKATPLAFLCHHGVSSRQAAEHFRALGFRDVHNVEGGIEAWSSEIDPSVPKY
ncbi:Grx4 family monothiol glutaredoxin [Coralloluteibacterium stylophorae]|uniref:Grx4 family monothiol glutaredoxin n=1 Tax=Coralloluteibacterium stylophorae TaxID=1776034 RepID=A0A8J8AWI0_9GAMM|nr:Grx4 family monothiol glutaredoxin [Coralloluteibacterium stylophorae]MBS7458243.1 Grx4 family monothiol glutaredoxin [Coralloluteibacterium stylophorae]